jgi:alkanesulfonate monooxygenase SsuD/methylene tetrahydromethanopterin reductase-like flavin-dependent oxidoreductase (luciferase family)
MEHNDPPGYQSRDAVRVKAQRPTGNVAGAGGLGVGLSYDQLRGVNNIIVGNPDTVTQKLTQVIERLSPGYIHIYGNEGAMPHDGVMRSIELLGKEVIPALHEIKLQPYE